MRALRHRHVRHARSLRSPLERGDAVAFRRSDGRLQYGTVEAVHEYTGTVTVSWCDTKLHKTLPIDKVSKSAYDV